MGKLSLNRKKGTENEEQQRGQRKITGFFPLPAASAGPATAPSGGSGVPAPAGLSKVHVRSDGSAENPPNSGSLLSPAARFKSSKEPGPVTTSISLGGCGVKRRLDSGDQPATAKRRPVSAAGNRSNSSSPVLEEVDLNSPRGLDTLGLSQGSRLESSRVSPGSGGCQSEDMEDDMFADWDTNEDAFLGLNDGNVAEMEEPTPSGQPPLSATFGRHRIIEIDQTVHRQLILLLAPQHPPHNQRKLILKGTWLTTVLTEGDILHVDAEWDNDVAVVDDRSGFIVVNPDHLVSGTAVVSALFCLRKAVLAEKFKGGGGGSKVMLLGTLVHQLFQDVLQRQEYSRVEILRMMDSLLKSPSTVLELAYLGLTEIEIRRDIAPFIDHIQFFVRRYMMGHPVAQPDLLSPDKPKKGQERPPWKGRIDQIVDIEENIWSPRLGIKGKIDLTVQIQGSKKRVVPLELKTGKPSFSAEHCGQVMLYTMMSRDRREDPGTGLLLYLRSSNMTEVSAGHNEQRGLIQLRNQLVAYLAQRISLSGESTVDQFHLPEPINFESACSKCDYLDVCCLYQKVSNTVPQPPDIMARLVPATLQHLLPQHLDWFLLWSNMLNLESGSSLPSLGHLWTQSPQEREAAGGSCLADLQLSGLTADSLQHCFTRPSRLPQIFFPGELVIVSSTKEFALSQGSVVHMEGGCITVHLDRDLSLRSGWRQEAFYLDRYEYQGSMAANFVAIGKLMGQTEQAGSLRSIIIDRQPPRFLPGLGRQVAVVAKGIIAKLNRVQQKAIFRCMMTENFSLIRGMPGSGKTTTIVGLIRLLAAIGQSVLVVAYTHSAVDTLLCKLNQQLLAEGADVKFLRIGRANRVHPDLLAFTAEAVAKDCTSCDQLSQLFNSYQIVAATCLSTDHPAIVNRTFQWCIVDEASQALLPSVIHPLLHASKFILVGDPAQLPPVVQNPAARKLGLAQSLFNLLDSPEATLDLNIQYRMNQTLADLANHLTYQGKLECGSAAVAGRRLQLNAEQLAAKWPPWLLAALDPERSAVMLDTSSAPETNECGGIYNVGEAVILLSIVRALLEGGLPGQELGLIAPYSAQVKHLKAVMKEAGLSNLEIGTVDQFQGRDKEVILYSCTRSFPAPDYSGGEGVAAGHILNDERRLNVAVTRARSKLVIVGDLVTLKREYQPFRSLAAFFTANSAILTLSGQDCKLLKCR